MVLPEGWFYQKDGSTREMVLPERWFHQRDGSTREMVLPERWFYQKDGSTREIHATEGGNGNLPDCAKTLLPSGEKATPLTEPLIFKL